MVSLTNMDIQYLKGIGPKSAELFRRIGAPTVGALLRIYPRMYEDWSKQIKIREACGELSKCIKVKILYPVRLILSKGSMKMYKSVATDGENNIDIIFFNNKYVIGGFLPGEEVLIFGNVTINSGRYEITNPKIKGINENLKLRPIYGQTKGLQSWKIESAVKNALELLPSKFPDMYSNDFLNNYDLCSLDFAIRNIHFPSGENELKEARKRLIFDELYLWQLSVNMLKGMSRQSTYIKIEKDYTKDFYFLLPFEPTNAQKTAIMECNEDMKSGKFSMSRLLQGDVGSGKTVVAAAIAYNAVKNGYQVAIMAPTEILATQHYETFNKLFLGLGINIELLTGSIRAKARREAMGRIKTGEASVIVGTHVLFSECTQFYNLGLVITDEQHRFGVNQRTNLAQKGNNPHVLVMSATPIPRTLALIIYGDLDISVLNELPPGRQKIDTFCVERDKRKRVYNFTKKLLDEGRQAYVVCPSIEENETDMVAVESYAKELSSGEFSEYNVGILHGKMKAKEKEEVMKNFLEGKLQLLISTTVIEVGVDVPNAAVMIIENAERFGLSQLHQLRGRVGRGKEKSYCIMISDNKGEDSQKRFKAMINSNDGFYLANEDLKFRGPGEFFGSKQHGIPNVKMSNMLKDMEIVKLSQIAVKETIEKSPDLSGDEFKIVKKQIQKLLETKIGKQIYITV